MQPRCFQTISTRCKLLQIDPLLEYWLCVVILVNIRHGLPNTIAHLLLNHVVIRQNKVNLEIEEIVEGQSHEIAPMEHKLIEIAFLKQIHH